MAQMKKLDTTILEAVNHIVQDHPSLALQIREIADIAYGKNRGEQKYFGLNELDKKLEKWLCYDNGFFVELGANNGIDQSNTQYFEKYRNWKGILVEPIPHNYLSCRKYRSQKTSIYCNACVSFDYSDRFVEIAYSNLMSTPLGLESDIASPTAHAEDGRRFLSPTDNVFVFGALAVPLNKLLIKSNAPTVIDLLSLDVEGAEIEVLKGVDHEAFRFKYMCIESRRFDKTERYLRNIGYNFIEKLSAQDYLFSGL